MPVFITRLRRWFAGGAIAAVLLVGGMYFYARHRVQNALKQVPEKIGLDIQQTATGFTVSKSEQGRTLFKIQASKAVQFKQSGRAELHDVTITLYGRDSTRFDQIYGDDFEYEQQSGDVTAKGDVQIDLEANPQGLVSPDQAPPKELKNPIHLKTSGLVFNQKTGNAYTKQKVEFQLPQASGSAVGIHYVAKTNLLTMDSQVNLVFTGSTAATVTADTARVSKDPHWVLLDRPHVQSGVQQCDSDHATLFLRNDNTLDSVQAQGNVIIRSGGPAGGHANADQLELKMADSTGTLRAAVLSGNVHAEAGGAQPIQATASRAVMDFVGKNVLVKVRAEENVKLLQHQTPAVGSAAQDVELTAPAVEFFVSAGRRLDRAETSPGGQIAIRSSGTTPGPQTLVTAGKFDARFDKAGQLSAVHGSPDARIVSQNPGQPDRVSTSQTLDAVFLPGKGIELLQQQGSVAYVDGERKAWGDHARYTTADQILVLTGSPRVNDGGMTSTARVMRLNRATGDAFADGDVKSTYNDLKAQPNGALLASSSPIHVTAQKMTVHGNSSTALYTGSARLWQDANTVEAPSIEFDRDRRSVAATAPAPQNVSTVLVQTNQQGQSTPVAITSRRLTYTDSERKAHFEENVVARGADVTITAGQVDAFLEARGQASDAARLSQAGKLEKIVAVEQVVVTQPNRRATGEHLLYTAAEDKFVLTGGSPSIFDAEHGKITGVSLTFFRRDDRVLVEGSNSSPTVTQTRVAR
jgi:lipopolysaccharide export system protein LptA